MSEKISNKKPNLRSKIAGGLAITATLSSFGASEASAETPPVTTLTHIIAKLDGGKQAEVAANKIAIPGPIGEAEGRPLVFTVNGQSYLAYSQGQEPNFDQKRPSDVAAEMAIIKEPKNDASMPLEEAHLNKQGQLVNDDQIAVGYSTGGETGK